MRPRSQQRGEADRVDEVARLEPGRDAAAGGVEVLQGGVPGGRAQELIHLGQRVRQVGEPGRVAAAGHGAVPGAAPNPAQAEVPGWAEYASSATVTAPVRAPGGLVAGDGQQVTVTEPAGQRRGAQRGVHRGGPGQRGELDRLGHLRADPGRARGGGLGQPGPGAVADRQERRLRLGGRLDPRRPRRPVRLLRVAG